MGYPVGIVAFVIGLLMVVGHYFPWPAWLRGQVINRFFCYSWGVGWVLIGALFVTASTHQNYLPLAEVLILFAAAGIVTVGCYGYDYWRDVSNRGKRRERVNNAR
jgi:hypothetical protein